MPLRTARAPCWLMPLGLVLVLFGGACGPIRSSAPVTPTMPAPVIPRELRLRSGGRVITVPLEDYVVGSSLTEVTPTSETAAVAARVYDVQTVVARTYAIAHLGRHRAEGFDLCDTTHCQLYEPARLTTSRFAAEARRAAARTESRILVYGARPIWPIDALFHADCGGHTSAPEQVWATPARPYLRARKDAAPRVTHRAWRVSLSRDELRKALNLDPRTTVGAKLTGVKALGMDSSGRVTSLALNGDRLAVVRSDDFRAIVNRTLGPKGVQSTRFSIVRSGMNYTLAGTGFGHGVGLCQAGALAWARRGAGVEAILAEYFPGATLGPPRRPGARIP